MKKEENNLPEIKANETNTTEESNKSETSLTKRRAIVASIAAAGAGGLPSQWKKPVVDHVLLPAHAELSIGSNTNPNTGTLTETMSETMSETTSATTSASSSAAPSTASAIGTTSGLVSCTDNYVTAFAENYETDGRNGGRFSEHQVTRSETVFLTGLCSDPFGGTTADFASTAASSAVHRTGVSSGQTDVYGSNTTAFASGIVSTFQSSYNEGTASGTTISTFVIPS